MVFVLVPGAGGEAWYWHLVAPLLSAAGPEVVAVDLPAGDEEAGLAEYADTIVAAADGAADVVLVAQSLGGFSAPLAIRPSTSIALFPPCSGWMSGCTTLSGPPSARASPQASRKCAAGRCQVAMAAVSSTWLPRWTISAAFFAASPNATSAAAV